MKITLVLFLAVLSHALLAKSYMIAGSAYDFIDGTVEYSKNCEKNCEAKQKVSQLKAFKLKPDSPFASGLGSYVCDKELKAATVLGVDENKNMKAFCFFEKDQSMVEQNSLGDYAKKFLKK